MLKTPKRDYSREETGSHHDSEKFSITLTGEGSTLKCDFTHPHFFHGIWEVGVKKLLFPRKVMNIDHLGYMMTVVKFKGENSAFKIIDLPMGHYDGEELIKEINSALEKTVMKVCTSSQGNNKKKKKKVLKICRLKTRFFIDRDSYDISACLFPDEKIIFGRKLAKQLGINTTDVIEDGRTIKWEDRFNIQNAKDAQIKTLHPKFELYQKDPVFLRIQNNDNDSTLQHFIEHKSVGDVACTLVLIAIPSESTLDFEDDNILLEYGEKSTEYHTIFDNRMDNLVVRLCDSSLRPITFDGKNMLILEFRQVSSQ